MERQTILHVDLETKGTWTEEVAPELMESYLGGRGVAAALLWSAVGPNADPLGPENPLIFAPGALTGLSAPSSGRTTVTCKGPSTNLYLKSSMGGDWGAALRRAGYEYLFVHGAASTPVYIWIDGPTVQIRPADHLWGHDVPETDHLVKEELGLHRAAVACIGPAGEKLVKFAAIMCSLYNAAGRGGTGAVMGAKRLKAVVISGTHPLKAARDAQFKQLAKQALKALGEAPHAKRLFTYGTSGTVPAINELRAFPSYNFQRGYCEGSYQISGPYLIEGGYLQKRLACYSCPVACHRFSAISSGPYAGTASGGPEYESFSALGSGCGITDTEVVIKANELCNSLGMDTISAGALVQWAMECVERGALSPAEVDGLDLRWGNGEALVALLAKIAAREGVGDLLADGVREAARRVGRGSERWAIEAKGLEQSRVETRCAKAYALAFAVNPRGPDHLHSQPIAEFGVRPEQVSLIEKITGDARYATPYMTEKRPEIVRWHEDCFAASDALGFCSFATTSIYAVDPAMMAALFEAATDLPMSEADLMLAGRRIVTLEKCFNVREGATRADDRLPWRLMYEESPDRPGAINSPEELSGMLDGYYALHGWDPSTSWPTRQTLESLGMKVVAGELARMGRLPEITERTGA
ncbi:MAG: aldehyde ferredoxin oxidoreductase family protein [Pirellulaceae bacterium]